MNYADAKAFCNESGEHLVTFKNVDSYYVVINLFKTNAGNKHYFNFYVFLRISISTYFLVAPGTILNAFRQKNGQRFIILTFKALLS